MPSICPECEEVGHKGLGIDCPKCWPPERELERIRKQRDHLEQLLDSAVGFLKQIVSRNGITPQGIQQIENWLKTIGHGSRRG